MAGRPPSLGRSDRDGASASGVPPVPTAPRASFLTDPVTSRDLFGVCRGRCLLCNECGRYKKHTSEYTVAVGEKGRRHPDNDPSLINCSRCGCPSSEHEMVQHEQEHELGNEAFALQQWDAAVVHYSRAISLCATDAALWSNRAAAYLAKGWAQQALHDAEHALSLRPNWAKAHGRKAAALLQLGRAEAAAKAFGVGLLLDAGSATLQEGLKKAQQVQHEKQAKQAQKAQQEQQPHKPRPQQADQRRQERRRPTAVAGAGGLPAGGVQKGGSSLRATPMAGSPRDGSVSSNPHRGASSWHSTSSTDSGIQLPPGAPLLLAWRWLQHQAAEAQAALQELQQGMAFYEALLLPAGAAAQLRSCVAAAETFEDKRAEGQQTPAGWQLPSNDPEQACPQAVADPSLSSCSPAAPEKPEMAVERDDSTAQQPEQRRPQPAVPSPSPLAEAASTTISHGSPCARTSSPAAGGRFGPGWRGGSARDGSDSGIEEVYSEAPPQVSALPWAAGSRAGLAAAAPLGTPEGQEGEERIQGSSGGSSRESDGGSIDSSASKESNGWTLASGPSSMRGQEAGLDVGAARGSSSSSVGEGSSTVGSATNSDRNKGAGKALSERCSASQQPNETGDGGSTASSATNSHGGDSRSSGGGDGSTSDSDIRNGSNSRSGSDDSISEAEDSSASNSESESEPDVADWLEAVEAARRQLAAGGEWVLPPASSSRRQPRPAQGRADPAPEAKGRSGGAGSQAGGMGGAASLGLQLGGLRQMCAAAEAAALARDAAGVPRAACKRCGSTACPRFHPTAAVEDVEAVMAALARQRSSGGGRNSSTAATKGGLLGRVHGGSHCAACGCPSSEHETEKETATRETRLRLQQQRLERQRLEQQRLEQQRQGQQVAGFTPAGPTIVSGDARAGVMKPEQLDDRQRRVMAAAKRRAVAERTGEQMQESDCDVMLQQKRAACGTCTACPGFRILLRNMDSNNPDIMFYCSLCGCRADQHAVDAQWQAEEAARRVAEQAAAQRRTSAAGAATGAMAVVLQQEADAYAELGLPLGTDVKSVARAYKRLALRLHPDKQPQQAQATVGVAAAGVPPGAQAAAAKERFVRVVAAYKLLSERAGGRH